jgi:pSer/pThr/pTyr-binding forkhead associated (FHA) protein
VRLRFRIRTLVAVGTEASTSSAPLERLVEAEPAGGELRVGRRAGVEIELPFPTVSGLHARIFRHGAGWAVADLGSANGTFTGATRLGRGVPHPLRRGDAIRVADDVVLVFEGEAGAQALGAEPVESTATMARRLVNDLFQAMPAAEVARVMVTSGPSAGGSLALALPDRPYKVGRAPECDLVLVDDDVSREHAAFERRWQGVFVRDLGSKNGVELGGRRLRAEQRLGDGQVVVLGGSELRVDDPEERYLRRMEEEARELARQADAEGSEPEVRATQEPTVSAAAAGTAARPAAAPGAGAGARPAAAPAPPPARPRPVGRSRLPTVMGGLAVLVLGGVGFLLWFFLFGASKIE